MFTIFITLTTVGLNAMSQIDTTADEEAQNANSNSVDDKTGMHIINKNGEEFFDLDDGSNPMRINPNIDRYIMGCEKCGLNYTLRNECEIVRMVRWGMATCKNCDESMTLIRDDKYDNITIYEHDLVKFIITEIKQREHFENSNSERIPEEPHTAESIVSLTDMDGCEYYEQVVYDLLEKCDGDEMFYEVLEEASQKLS